MDLDPNTDLSFTRRLPVPRNLVWECWTTPTHIPNFFIPEPHKVTACEIDLRVGGRFDTTFDVDGNIVENKGVYLDIEPERRLVFTDAYTEGWKPSPDPFMTAMILLDDAADGGTTYTAVARHRSAEAAQTHENMGFFDGWGTVVDQLVKYAQSLR
ncbi:SRPBCC family protein [Celeribacter arenosi]|uniref:SRPBCC family protein n=1 Tax=Celeribacter arenosi TaxID=792649 RepID=A0ABP7KBR8_9RHOB